jgi:hypothetical protein
MNKSEILANRAIGVLGVMRDERSLRDNQMRQEYNMCNGREGFNANSGAGVTEIPAEYAQGWDKRSVKDQMDLAKYNTCNKEGFDGCYQYADIRDNPFNPTANYAERAPVSSFNRQ